VVTQEKAQAMTKHFVIFYSPGTLVAEMTKKPIDEWDVEVACAMARGIKERYGATPYAFQFETRDRSDEELDSKVIARSAYYFLGGKVETIKEVLARATYKDHILVANMLGNGYEHIITNTNSWTWMQPFDAEKDVVLDWKP
jgi:hypothetical protein